MPVDVRMLVPWLRPERVEQIHGGWTCDTYCIDGTWIVQVARSAYAAETLRHQVRTLPLLAKHLDARIPSPELVSDDPTATLYRRLEGVRCDEAAPGRWPEQLGALLGQLHALAPRALGLEPTSAHALRERAGADLRRMQALLAPRLSSTDRAGVERFVQSYLDPESWVFPLAPIHCDLGPEHVLVSPSGELSGVIDWEELQIGDPAWDLCGWVNQMPEIGRRMLESHGAVDAAFHERTRRVYPLKPWLHEFDHGVRSQDEALIASAIEGIRARL